MSTPLHLVELRRRGSTHNFGIVWLRGLPHHVKSCMGSLLCANVVSLIAAQRRLELLAFLRKTKIKFVILSETWFTSKVDPKIFPGYHAVHSTLLTGQPKWGVSVLIPDNVPIVNSFIPSWLSLCSRYARASVRLMQGDTTCTLHVHGIYAPTGNASHTQKVFFQT